MDIIIHLMDFIIGIEPVKNAGHLNGKCLTINEDLFYFLQKLRGQIQ